MNCDQCGLEMEDGTVVCPNCHVERDDRIQVLPPEERESFQGLTIARAREDERRDDARGPYEYQNEGGPHRDQRIYVRRFSLGNTPGGILGKLIIGAVLVGLIILALPLVLLGIGIFLVWILLARARR